ncbi:MAG: endonuclease/exonuclease/phosphatase family protein [Patescibacteria group bacterium]|nr:endonuclease/exonuclease/phosphatase family protein [Patescibacteria group bacterium]
MKLIALNIWGGQVYEPLINFLKKQSKIVDVFCFQEVFKSDRNIFHNRIKTNVYSDIAKILKDYNGYFAPMFAGHDTKEKVDFELLFGQATFVKNSIKILSEGDIFVYGSYGQERTKPVRDGNFMDFPRNIHFVDIENPSAGSRQVKKTLIANLHGFWISESKEDTPERFEQSDRIIKFLRSYKHRKILCGDFNLNPDTKSMLILEKNMVNLVKKYKVKSTRSNLHTRKDKFADYILVSKDIKVLGFKVLQDEVSDHLPLFLEFN